MNSPKNKKNERTETGSLPENRKNPEPYSPRASLRHELLNPLNAIIGYSELLLEEAEMLQPDEFVPDLNKIRMAGKSLLDIVNKSFPPVFPVPGEDPFIPPSEEEQVTRPDGSSLTTPIPTTREETEFDVAPEIIKGRILVVDDSENNRNILARNLIRQGHTVDEAENGRQALEKLQGNFYDTVLLDVIMPEMDGYSVLLKLKSDDLLRHIPVIMISALDELESVVRCIEGGAEDYLPKPFNPVLLKARLGASLEKKRFHDTELKYLQQIEKEKEISNQLLHVILPHPVVEELKTTNRVIPRRYDHVAVLFCDIVGFTQYCDRHEVEHVVHHLQELVDIYEGLMEKWNLQKIKTIGDCFMATAGLLTRNENAVMDAVACGLDMKKAVRQLSVPWTVRIGIHSGAVMAGVVGARQYLYDIWGDTVNTAARVESNGRNNAVNVSREVWDLISTNCSGHALGLKAAKGKGALEIFVVDGLVSG